MSDFSDFDRYCDEHNIQSGEEPAAFAAWLNEQTGWDGPMGEAENLEYCVCGLPVIDHVIAGQQQVSVAQAARDCSGYRTRP